jgi:hypothetical protein
MPANLAIKSNIKEWERLALATIKEFNAPKTIRNVEKTLTPRFQRLSREQFETQGGFGREGRWQQLSEPYRTWKEKRFPGKTILRRTDRMFRSYTTRRENIAFAARFGASSFVYKYGTTVPYAEHHYESLNMPRRSVMNYTDRQLHGITAAIGRTIVQGLFSRMWFDSFERGTLLPGFRIRGRSGFDAIELP